MSLQQFRLQIIFQRYHVEISQAIHTQHVISIFASSCLIAWILQISYLKSYSQGNLLSDNLLCIITCILPAFGIIGAREYKKINNKIETILKNESKAIQNYYQNETAPSLHAEQEVLERINKEAKEWSTISPQTLFSNKLIGHIMEILFIILQLITILLICIEIKEPSSIIMFSTAITPLIIIYSIILYCKFKHE